MKVENKVALITGGASGMGEAAAILFAKEKAKVIIADIDGAKGEEVARRIKKEGGDCAFVKGDVSKVADVKAIIDVTIRTFKRLDVLFNNAGMPMAGTELEKIEESLWDNIMNVNLKSIFLFSKYAVPFMKKQGGKGSLTQHLHQGQTTGWEPSLCRFKGRCDHSLGSWNCSIQYRVNSIALLQQTLRCSKLAAICRT
jgi:NAD(P)-dependent dehydrogenase (short-subunit alcohol dehydrogenase family)